MSDECFLDLPLDVARVVFEFAAIGDKRTGVSLLHSSKAICQWIEPILYHSVVLETVSTLEMFVQCMVARDSLDFFSKNVKSLRLGSYKRTMVGWVDQADVRTILSACRGLEHLAWWLGQGVLYSELLQEAHHFQHLRSVSLLDHNGVHALPSAISHLYLDINDSFGVSVIQLPRALEQCRSLTRIFLTIRWNALFGPGLADNLNPAITGLPPSFEKLIIWLRSSGRPIFDASRVVSQAERLVKDKRVVFVASRSMFSDPSTAGTRIHLHDFTPAQYPFLERWSGSQDVDIMEFLESCMAKQSQGV